MSREIISVNPFNFNNHLWDVEMIATWCNWRVEQTLRPEVLVEDECQAKSTLTQVTALVENLTALANDRLRIIITLVESNSKPKKRPLLGVWGQQNLNGTNDYSHTISDVRLYKILYTFPFF